MTASADADIDYLLAAPGLVLAQMLVVKASKLGTSYLFGRREVGPRRSVFMGVALSVKFSTSIVIIKLLFERGLIGSQLYSVLIASKIGFKFVVPFLLAYLSSRWGITPDETESGERTLPTR